MRFHSVKKTKVPITFIPNGIDLNVKIKKRLKYKNYILFVAARIYRVKGLDILIDALNNLNYKGKVLVIGDHTMI